MRHFLRRRERQANELAPFGVVDEELIYKPKYRLLQVIQHFEALLRELLEEENMPENVEESDDTFVPVTNEVILPDKLIIHRMKQALQNKVASPMNLERYTTNSIDFNNMKFAKRKTLEFSEKDFKASAPAGKVKGNKSGKSLKDTTVDSEAGPRGLGSEKTKKKVKDKTPPKFAKAKVNQGVRKLETGEAGITLNTKSRSVFSKSKMSNKSNTVEGQK